LPEIQDHDKVSTSYKETHTLAPSRNEMQANVARAVSSFKGN